MSKHISSVCVKRIMKDIYDIRENPLTDHGIFYEHDEEDILKGKFLIIGNNDTPYSYGYYLFDITFPENYPFSPPICRGITNDGITRFNPNLYRDGKVCLSILNTWSGEQWSGCQSISTILLNICSNIFVDNPLLNEPGIPKLHYNIPIYNEIISYKNIDFSIVSQLKNMYIQDKYPIFYNIMKQKFIENYKNIVSNIQKNKKCTLHCCVYRMNITIDSDQLLKDIEDLYKRLN